MIKATGVIAALVLGLIARVFAGYALSYFGVHSPANIDNLSAIIQYAVIFGLGVVVAKQANVSARTIFGEQVKLRYVIVGGFFAVLLLMLNFGVNATETWSVAQFNPQFAYQFWHFHEAVYYVSMPAVSFVVLIIAQFVCAPIVEEFLFRGLLFRAWLRHGAVNAMFGVAILFTVLHYGRHYWITTFIFSVVLSILYLKYNSLWVNIVAHAANNFVAFLIQYNFDFHWTRPINRLVELHYWIPELVMLAISAPIIIIFVAKSYPFYGGIVQKNS